MFNRGLGGSPVAKPCTFEEHEGSSPPLKPDDSKIGGDALSGEVTSDPAAALESATMTRRMTGRVASSKDLLHTRGITQNFDVRDLFYLHSYAFPFRAQIQQHTDFTSKSGDSTFNYSDDSVEVGRHIPEGPILDHNLFMDYEGQDIDLGGDLSGDSSLIHTSDPLNLSAVSISILSPTRPGDRSQSESAEPGRRLPEGLGPERDQSVGSSSNSLDSGSSSNSPSDWVDQDLNGASFHNATNGLRSSPALVPGIVHIEDSRNCEPSLRGRRHSTAYSEEFRIFDELPFSSLVARFRSPTGTLSLDRVADCGQLSTLALLFRSINDFYVSGKGGVLKAGRNTNTRLKHDLLQTAVVEAFTSSALRLKEGFPRPVLDYQRCGEDGSQTLYQMLEVLGSWNQGVVDFCKEFQDAKTANRRRTSYSRTPEEQADVDVVAAGLLSRSRELSTLECAKTEHAFCLAALGLRVLVKVIRCFRSLSTPFLKQGFHSENRVDLSTFENQLARAQRKTRSRRS